MNFKKTKENFNSLTESGQWLWAIKNKDIIELILDNDNTSFTFNDEDKTEDCTLVQFKADIGNRWGIEFLIKNLGFSFKFC